MKYNMISSTTHNCSYKRVDTVGNLLLV